MIMKLNPHISVDCVVFGFDKKNLKVLLLKRKVISDTSAKVLKEDFKLPGSLISDREDLDHAAYRVLKELTGLDNIYLSKFDVFGSPDRVKNKIDRLWLHQLTGLPVERIVTVAYYSLIKLDEANRYNKILHQDAQWINVNTIRRLAFDHNEIFTKALSHLRKELRTEPVGFELLPHKFTLRQLQDLYEVIMGRELDNRNFRKKLLKLHYIVQLEEKEIHVNHKPALFYRFDKTVYEKEKKEFMSFVV